MPDAATAKIAALNDRAWQTFRECRVIITEGVQALENVDAILRQVQLFDAFTPNNDPFSEHDFGSIQLAENTSFGRLITTTLTCTCTRQIPVTRL